MFWYCNKYVASKNINRIDSRIYLKNQQGSMLNVANMLSKQQA